MAQKITHWLLISLVLTLGFGQLLRFEAWGIPLYLHDLLVVLILILNLRGLSSKVRKVSLGLKLLFLGLGLGWLQALTLYPLVLLLTPFLYTLRLLAYIALYLILKAHNYKLKASYLLFSGFISVLIGTLQYFLMPDMRLFQYLGWDDHLNRVILPHFDPTFSSVMFVIFGLLAYETKHYWLALVSLPAVFLSYARSTWLSTLVTLTTRLPRYLVIGLSLAVIVVAVLLPRGQYGEGTNLLRTYSISSRVSYDLSLLSSVGWRSIIGVGYNTLSLRITPVKEFVNHATGTNNSYLEIFLTTGILGLLGSLLILRDFSRTFPYKSILTFILIASFFNNVLLYPFVMLWLVMLSLSYNR